MRGHQRFVLAGLALGGLILAGTQWRAAPPLQRSLRTPAASVGPAQARARAGRAAGRRPAQSAAAGAAAGSSSRSRAQSSRPAAASPGTRERGSRPAGASSADPSGQAAGDHCAPALTPYAADRRRRAAAQAPAPLAQEPDGQRPEILGGAIVAGLDDLSREATRVVVGRVIGRVCRWNPERTAIHTYVTLAVRRTLKGRRSARVTVRVVGGRIPGESVGLSVSHQPSFEVGQEGIVFIDDDPRLHTSVVACQQGYLRFELTGPRRALVRDGYGRPISGVSSTQRLLVGRRDRITAKVLIARVERLCR